MTEDLLLKVQASYLHCLSLCLIDGYGKAGLNRKLDSFEVKGQICWYHRYSW